MPHRIIVALGNSGDRYVETRHNVAHMFAHYYCAVHNCGTLSLNAKLQSTLAQCSGSLLALPTTFMNVSGDSTSLLLRYYEKTAQEDLIVIHDDLDLRLGEYKVSRDKNAGGHNGVADITHKCNTKDYLRIRIGIDNRTKEERAHIAGRDYVLGRFPSSEKDILNNLFPTITDELDALITL